VINTGRIIGWKCSKHSGHAKCIQDFGQNNMKGGDIGIDERICATISFSSGILLMELVVFVFLSKDYFVFMTILGGFQKTAYSVMTFLVVTAPNYHSDFVQTKFY
jgi:hypothetical protein